jgi:hypothetical protein
LWLQLLGNCNTQHEQMGVDARHDRHARWYVSMAEAAVEAVQRWSSKTKQHKLPPSCNPDGTFVTPVRYPVLKLWRI